MNDLWKKIFSESHFIYIFVEDASVKVHDELMLAQLDALITSIKVINQVSERKQFIPEEHFYFKK